MRPIERAKPALFVICLLPAAWLAAGAFGGWLGPNPVETLLHETGLWALRLLLLTLAVSPLHRLGGWQELGKLRRMLGLYVFFYATLHLLVYVGFEQAFVWDDILADVRERPFITLGMACYALLLPLALTSSAGMARRLGAGNWQRLHRLAYVIAAGGVLHYWWLVKLDTRAPLFYALLLGLLLGLRLLPARAGP